MAKYERKIKETCKEGVLHKPATMENEEESKDACAVRCLSWNERGFTVTGFTFNSMAKICSCMSGPAGTEVEGSDEDESCEF